MTAPRPWRTAYASVAGTSHATSATPCQDFSRATVVRAGEAEILLAAVADGAGTARCSAQAARLAVASFSRAFGAAAASDPGLNFFDRAFAVQWLDRLRCALRILAEADGAAFADYACTFLGAVVADAVAGFVQIGDGAIVVAEADRAPRWIFWPQHGEFANSTWFVTHDDAVRLVQVRRDATCLHEAALFSDGMERLVLDFAARAVHGPALRPMFSWLARSADVSDACGVLQAYLDSPAVNRRTDDDKTLVLATRAAAQ